MGAALDAILPEGAVGVERGSVDGGDPLPAAPELYPEEAELIAGASAGRRRAFAEGRACAREALRQLGVPSGPIPATDDGAPVWPEGIVGSITHKGGYRAAVVARRSSLAGIGIDAELDRRLPEGLLETIASAAELEQVEELLWRRPVMPWDRLLFSAKEAAVKAAQPLGLEVAGVRSVEVCVAPDARSFTAILARTAPVVGAWIATDGLLVTVVRAT
jgi:4'-phosphopantetheinyl transferase EntD